MASYSSAANDVNFVQQNYRAFLLRIEEVRQDVANGAGVQQVGGTVARLLSSIGAQVSLISTIQDVTIPSITDASQNEIEALYNLAGDVRDNLNNLDTELRRLLREAQQNDKDRDLLESEPKNSAADENQQDDDAADEGSRTQNPPAEKTVINEDNDVVPETQQRATTTNAQKPQLEDNSNLGNQDGTNRVGGDEPTKTTTITQNGGDVAPNDDLTDPVRETVGVSSSADGRPAIAPDFLNQIVATENKLKGLATQTYTISIYMMDEDDFTTLIETQRKTLPGKPNLKSLIIQSGGIPFGERNPWFLEDFYIENLYLNSIVGTQGAASPHNVAALKFTILEPQGITFLNRLNNAVKQYTGNDNISELSQNYLMVIRFYGYDDAGNLLSGTDLGVNERGSDPRSIVEKFIPFQLADITYRIGTKATEYNVEATVPTTNVGFSTGRATIPFNMQLVAPDVQTLLNGNLLLASTGNNDPENDETTRLSGATVTQGLCEALNEHERLLANKGGYEYPDIYEIELEDTPGLRDAKLAKPGKQIKKRAPMNTSSDPASKFLSSKTTYDKDSKTYNITAGTQVVQLIDLVMRSSSYITSQQNIIFDEKTGEIKNQNPVSTVQWYRIRCRVTPYKYDKERRDFAYKIKYTISRYQINTPRSAYFPPAAYRGVHKIYNYWFTGENTEVLDFEINVNANFQTIFGNDGLTDNTASGRWFEKRVFQTRPNASSQGGEGESTMPAASLSARLYNPLDVADATMEIVGDPDWIQQNEIFYNREIILTPTLPDGSLNFDASEVLYELRFNPVNDYDLGTGLTPVYQNNVTYSQVTGETNLPQESIVWAAATVESYFTEGKFTQKVRGTIRDFAGAVNKINGTSAKDAANPESNVKTETEKTTPKPTLTETGGAVPADITSVATGTNLDVAGGTVDVSNNVGFFDNIADDDAGDQITFSP